MHFPILIQDLAVILSVAAVMTFIFRRINQPVVLAYIIAGIIVGPYTPDILSVTDTQSIKVWAELGVIFLMFTLGLEFSFRRLARVGMSAGITAIIQIIAMVFWGIVTASLIGWSKMDAIFLGCMISISSTTIIIKALDELGLKTKKFAELVFGVLIVEDLAAILMLVALTNIATTSQIGGIDLILAGVKLAIVVGAWFLVGMFLVPRFVKSVSHHGNDEMLTVVAISLCLALVALAASFHYSVALGAFIMGSILAESSEVERIEHLVMPLKDIFGAVFFVSVGMLLNPNTIVDNLGAVAMITIVIIAGKLTSVTFGAFITGQTIRNSIQTGFSMAQIGEFSFIIASLGLSYKVINEELYPIIVASSLVTTFTTPYLVKASSKVAEAIDKRLPSQIKDILNNYVTWMQRQTISQENKKILFKSIVKWFLNAIAIITLFALSSEIITPLAENYIEQPQLARGAAWLFAFILSSPSIWATLNAFRDFQTAFEQRISLPRGGILLISRIITIGLIGSLSFAFFPALITLLITVSLCGLLLFAFRRQIESYYRWFELQFESGFQLTHSNSEKNHKTLSRLAPWDAHLVEVKVPSRSFLVGKTLLELQLREKYGLNVVVIIRGKENIVAPKASEPLYPSDRLLCFATDNEIERFKDDVESFERSLNTQKGLEAYDMRRFKVRKESELNGVSIRESGIRERFGCIVVGLERDGKRIRSPGSDTRLATEDVIWVVGEANDLHSLSHNI